MGSMRLMKRISASLAALVGALVLAATVSAGGTDLVTVKNFPDFGVVGTPISLTFKVWVPSEEPLRGVHPVVHATNENGREIRTDAKAITTLDHYTATLTFPEAGDWIIVFDTEYKNAAKMPPLKVIAPGAPHPSALPLAAQGLRLFRIKGCNGCHIHPDVKDGDSYAPDLTDLRLSASYLRKFLADPSIRKAPELVCSRDGSRCGSPYDMPSLDLKKPEIEALVAFLTTK